MTKIKKTTMLLLLLIFAVGVVLRFYRLGDVPAGFHRDEAFLGYNAYSLLKTGKDISGHFLPVHLESFLYSPAGYSYLSIPSIALFDLSAFSVRFASALFGSLTVVLVYFLSRELFASKKYSYSISTIAAVIFALSPWHINLSRTATENVVVVFFILLGTLLYLLWTRRVNRWLFVLSFFSFALTIFLYQAPRAFLPFFLPLLVVFFPPTLHRKQATIAWVTVFLASIILPLIFIFISKDLNLRLRTVSIFATKETQLVLEDHILTDGVFAVPLLQTRLFHNKPVIYAQAFLENYFSHFSHAFLFSDKGFPERYKVPRTGLLYGIELPFLFFGLWRLIANYKKVSFLLLGWLVVVPLGSGLTFDDIPNLQRTLMMVPVLSLFISYGIVHGFLLLKTFLKKVSAILVVAIFVYSVFFYLHQYYVHSPVYRPWYRHDGYKQLVSSVNNVLPKYQKAIITDRESAPTIFFLFYGKYDPDLFQKETKNTTMRDFDRISFNRYEFSQEECPLKEETERNETIYVNSGLCKIPTGIKGYEEIKRQDNSAVFRIFAL